MTLPGRAAIGTTEFDASVAFYARLLGCAPESVARGYAEFRVPGLRLAIFKPRSGEEAAFVNAARTGGLALCFDVTNLETTLALFTREKPHATAITTASHGRECSIFDPDGNRVILYEPVNPSS